MTKIETVPAGKIKCYVTGKLREDSPEEHVRQRMARSLVEEYGYDKNLYYSAMLNLNCRVHCNHV